MKKNSTIALLVVILALITLACSFPVIDSDVGAKHFNMSVALLPIYLWKNASPLPTILSDTLKLSS